MLVRSRKEFGKAGVPYVFFFWCVWKARNNIIFRDDVLSIYIFVFILWLETKMSILDSPSILVQFIDWVDF